MDLFHDLPRDIALQCLIRVSYYQFQSLRSVCKAWKAEIDLPELLHLRKSAGKAQSLVVLSQARVNPNGNRKCLDIPVYRLVVLEPETGCWSELPRLPEFTNGLPLFCELVAVGCDLVVIGGYDPQTWDCKNSVFVYDFLSSTWRRGADMPGGPRSFFGCATDGDRTVFIAGGHDLEKNALKSVWVYDVATDDWTQLPDMEKERDECKGLFHRGKFHVINGYPTDMQGHFHQSVEIYDMSSRLWSESGEMLSEPIGSPKIYVEGSDRKLYTHQANGVVALEDGMWRLVTELPVKMANTPCLTSLLGHLLLTGASKYCEPHDVVYKMDLNERVWSKVQVPVEFSGHIQSSCCLVI